MGLGNHKGVFIGISFLHEGMSERKEGAVLLTLKAEEGTMSQGKQAGSKTWKRQEFSHRTFRRTEDL